MLREHPEGITRLQCLQEVGCFEVSARIIELKAAGHLIDAEMEQQPNGKRVARYRLVQPTLWP